MGIRTFTFNGESSDTYGILITQNASFNAPERAGEMLSIPGRNGAFWQDYGRFENIEVTYHCVVGEGTKADFVSAMSDVRSWLCSPVGYCRLEDDYNPDEYRLAVYKSGLETDEPFVTGAEFEITFDCKPQRYLKSGETPITIGEWGETTTYTGEIAQFENPNGYLAMKSLTADIEPLQDLHGYDKPWVGGAGKNLLKITDHVLDNGSIVCQDGIVTATKSTTSNYSVRLEWFTAPKNGSYILNGSLGGSSSTYQLRLYNSSGNTVLARSMDGDSEAVTLNEGESYGLWLFIFGGQTLTNKVFYPMIRLASETDATYEPYENICPITGFTGCEVDVSGKNLLNLDTTGIVPSQASYSDGVISIVDKAFTSNAAYRIGTFTAPKTDSYIFSGSVGGSTSTYQLRVYNSDGASVIARSINGDSDAFTLTENTTYSVYAFMYANYTASGLKFKPMLRLATESADYSPYNDTTYPVSWQDEAGTVYGGTVDVVSGVLTVNKASTTISSFSNRSGTATTGKYRFYTSAYSDALAPSSASVVTTAICNEFNATSNINTYSNVTGFSLHSTEKRFYFYSDVLAELSVADANTWLSSNSIQVVYELATPTTYQLDPVQVACLLGQNNVWNNVGDTSIEVGNDPNYVINPTRFEAQPQLQVWGYGDISIKDKIITINNVLIGNIKIGEATSFYKSWSSPPFPTTIDVSSLNTGDAITFAGLRVVWARTPKAGCTNLSYEVTLSENVSYSITNGGATVDLTFGTLALTYGTSASSVRLGKITLNQSYDYGGGRLTANNVNYSLLYSYDGNDTLSWYVLGDYTVGYVFSGGNFTAYIPEAYADSTMSALGSPSYIDLDVGECWKEISGTPTSINSAVTLPSELPTLASGANEITYDNTVTQLDIVPRWWQV